MKVIFLDIDGVLNSFDDYTAPDIPTHIWSPDMMHKCGIPLEVRETHIRRINKLIEKTGAKVVLTSSWRKGDDAWWASLLQTMYDKGLWPDSIIDKTPDLRANRGDEVVAWLKDHPEVTHFVIFDDINEFELQGLLDNFVQTDYQLGVTKADIDRAKKILGL